jgi:hypothetical protein
MKLNKYLFSFSILLFTLSLIKLDRFFLKKNHGFCLHFIHGPLSHQSKWETATTVPEHILNQKFFYLGKGSQTYVFESEDQKHVLKFYKFPSHMRRVGWLKHPFSYRLGEKRRKIKAHNEKKFQLSYDSYALAHKELLEETGVVYTHLNPSHFLHRNVMLVDKLGTPYKLGLDQCGFILQKKATSLFPFLTALLEKNDTMLGKKVVDSVIQLICTRCQKGIRDLDNMDHNNYGWLEGKAIHIDVGRFVPDATIKSSEKTKEEVVRITQKLSDFLAKHSPELYTYYQEKIQQF